MSTIDGNNNPQLVNKINQIYVNIDGSHYERTMYGHITIENTKSTLFPNRNEEDRPLSTQRNHNSIHTTDYKSTIDTDSRHRRSNKHLNEKYSTINPRVKSYMKTESLIRNLNKQVDTYIYNVERNFRRIIPSKPSQEQKKQALEAESAKQLPIRRGSCLYNNKRMLYNDYPHYKQFLTSIKKLATKVKYKNKKYEKKGNDTYASETNDPFLYPKVKIKNTMDFSNQMPKKQFFQIKTERKSEYSKGVCDSVNNKAKFQINSMIEKGKSHLCSQVSFENETKYHNHLSRGNQLNEDIKELNKVAKIIFLLRNR